MYKRIEPSDARNEALSFLEKLSNELVGAVSNPDRLEAHLQNYWKAISLLDWDVSWVASEMRGYKEEKEAPTHRFVPSTERWESGSYSIQDEKLINYCLTYSVPELLGYRRKMVTVRTSERKTYGSTAWPIEYGRVVIIPASSIERCLQAISVELYDRVLKAIREIKFGEAIESAFRAYQASIDPALAQLGIDDYLKTSYEDLSKRSESSWQNSTMACRNLIHELSNKLWQSNDESYPYLPGEGGKPPLKVTKEKYVARLRAYLHQNGLGRDDMLMKMLDPLYSMASKGKESKITYEDAQSVLIHTHIFLGEMVRFTGMKPLTQIHAVQSP